MSDKTPIKTEDYIKNGRDTRVAPQCKLGSLEFQAQFLEHARKGLPIRLLCDLAQISHETYFSWQRQATEGIEPYATFIRKVHEARAKDAAEIYEKTKEWAEKKKDPKYGLKILSQIHKVIEEKSSKKTIEHTGGVQVGPAFDVSKLDDADFTVFMKLVEKMNSGKKTPAVENQEPILISEFSSE